MSMTDPVADLLTRIRNGCHAGHESVLAPHSRLKEAVVRLLHQEGFLAGYQVLRLGTREHLRVDIKYDRDRKGIIRGMQRVSKPSRRVYVRRDQVPFVRNGLGLAILTTPKGVLTDADARRHGIGGEVICYVW